MDEAYDWASATVSVAAEPPTVSTGADASSAGSAPPAFDEPRFRVLREIARGGMGCVLAAIDLSLGREVAIKTCRTRSTSACDRLVREAAILSRLDHPAVPPVYELGRQACGAPYFVTKLIEGETLEERLTAHPDRWQDAIAIVASVAEVMAELHEHGLIHRDLKPSNILIDRDGRVWVIDWGIARVTGPASALRGDGERDSLYDRIITTPGSAVGTPGYWAPEQRAGEVGDHRSDVYSLAMCLFRVVTGTRAPTRATDPAILAGALGVAPAWLRAVIARASAHEPLDRHPSARELAADLRRGLDQVAAEPPPPREPTAPRRRRWSLLGAASMVLRSLTDAPTVETLRR